MVDVALLFLYCFFVVEYLDAVRAKVAEGVSVCITSISFCNNNLLFTDQLSLVLLFYCLSLPSPSLPLFSSLSLSSFLSLFQIFVFILPPSPISLSLPFSPPSLSSNNLPVQSMCVYVRV